MSLSQQLSDYDSGDATLPLQYLDYAIDPGTLVCVDFLDPQCYPSGSVPAAGGSLPAGTTFTNLADSTRPLSLVQAWASGLGAGGGIQMAAALQTMTLPATCKLGALATAHFGFGGALKMPAALPAGNVAVGGYASSTAAANVQWLINMLASGSLQGNVGGIGVNVPAAASEVLSFFFEALLTGGIMTMSGYKNGALVSQASAALAALPVPSSTVVLGVSGGGGAYTQAMGSWDRFVFTDFTVANTKTPAQYAADEYSQIAGARFS